MLPRCRLNLYFEGDGVTAASPLNGLVTVSLPPPLSIEIFLLHGQVELELRGKVFALLWEASTTFRWGVVSPVALSFACSRNHEGANYFFAGNISSGDLEHFIFGTRFLLREERSNLFCDAGSNVLQLRVIAAAYEPVEAQRQYGYMFSHIASLRGYLSAVHTCFAVSFDNAVLPVDWRCCDPSDFR